MYIYILQLVRDKLIKQFIFPTFTELHPWGITPINITDLFYSTDSTLSNIRLRNKAEAIIDIFFNNGLNDISHVTETEFEIKFYKYDGECLIMWNENKYFGWVYAGKVFDSVGYLKNKWTTQPAPHVLQRIYRYVQICRSVNILYPETKPNLKVTTNK